MGPVVNIFLCVAEHLPLSRSPRGSVNTHHPVKGNGQERKGVTFQQISGGRKREAVSGHQENGYLKA